MNLHAILKENEGNIALVIGNGINRYGAYGHYNSWGSLVRKLAEDYLSVESSTGVTDGISLPEFYDLVQISAKEKGVEKFELHKKFCEPMSKWRPCEHHEAIVSWAQRHSAPILTTNFDRVLHKAAKTSLRHWTTRKGRTYHYPWECHYAPQKVRDPEAEFAIWHINGIQRYSRSIRLGLTDYMGSVRRARTWLRSSREDSLLMTRDFQKWRGMNTWLQVMITKPLLFFGLALKENEVFLRWLLIERKKYYQRNKTSCPPSWFVDKSEIRGGRRLFLENIDIIPVSVASYKATHDPNLWS